jgi:hypothetical protein
MRTGEHCRLFANRLHFEANRSSLAIALTLTRNRFRYWTFLRFVEPASKANDEICVRRIEVEFSSVAQGQVTQRPAVRMDR